MKTLSEYPKAIMISRTSIQVQLGIFPMYTVELTSVRNLKKKCLEIKPDHENVIKAPNGYRITRIWSGAPSVANELTID